MNSKNFVSHTTGIPDYVSDFEKFKLVFSQQEYFLKKLPPEEVEASMKIAHYALNRFYQSTPSDQAKIQGSYMWKKMKYNQLSSKEDIVFLKGVVDGVKLLGGAMLGISHEDKQIIAYSPIYYKTLQFGSYEEYYHLAKKVEAFLEKRDVPNPTGIREICTRIKEKIRSLFL